MKFSNLIFVRPEKPRSAAKSSLQAVTAEHPQTEIPAPERLPGACTSQGHVSPDHMVAGPGAGCFPASGLGIDFRLASMPVLWSNFGISAGSHPEREFTGQPPLAQESDSSSTSPVLFRPGNPTHVFGWGEPSNPSCSAGVPAFRTLCVDHAGCASRSDSSSLFG